MKDPSVRKETKVRRWHRAKEVYLFKESLEENVAILCKAVELKKKRIKLSVRFNNFKVVVILCPSYLYEVERKKSDCNGLEGEWGP